MQVHIRQPGTLPLVSNLEGVSHCTSHLLFLLSTPVNYFREDGEADEMGWKKKERRRGRRKIQTRWTFGGMGAEGGLRGRWWSSVVVTAPERTNKMGKKPIRFSKRGDCQGAAGPEIRWRCEDDTQWKYHVDEIECVSFNLEGRGLWLSQGCRWPGPYFCWTRSKSVSLEELLGHGTLSRLPAVGNIHHRASDGLNLDWMPGWINVLFCDLVSFFFFFFSFFPPDLMQQSVHQGSFMEWEHRFSTTSGPVYLLKEKKKKVSSWLPL